MENTELNEMSCHDDKRRVKEECIVALKVYDSCRQQDCLTPRDLSQVLSAENQICLIGGATPPDEDTGEYIRPGYPIDPPANAAQVRIVKDSFKLSDIRILSVEPRQFTNDGYWDVDLKFVFTFGLQFLDAAMNVIPIRCYDVNNPPIDYPNTIPADTPFEEKKSICASTVYNKRVTLFGSRGNDITVSTNLLDPSTSTTGDAPYVLVEAKAVHLDAKIKKARIENFGSNFDPDIEDSPNAVIGVNITIGLFTIIKLIRLVNLTVESKGFCKPRVCENISADPCDFFNHLEFPFDAFNPPQKEDFFRED